LPGHKIKECLLVPESLRFDAGVRGNAIQIEGCRRSEQVASGSLGNEGQGKVQDFSSGNRGRWVLFNDSACNGVPATLIVRRMFKESVKDESR
jgi:hypothetical protein